MSSAEVALEPLDAAIASLRGVLGALSDALEAEIMAYIRQLDITDPRALIAERGLSFTPPNDGDDPYAG